MNPCMPTATVLEAIRVIDALLVNVPADSALRLRAINAVEDMRGRLLAALPERTELRDAA